MESGKRITVGAGATTEVVGKDLATCSNPAGACEDIICDGKYVVVERGDQQRIILFNSQQTISFGKGSTQQDILLAGALGKRFLSAFKTSPAPPDVVTQCKSTSDKGRHGKKQGKRGSPQNFFVLEESTESIANSINEFYQLPDTISSGTDNRNIVDDNSSQKMKKQDIIELREQGVSSKDILDTILTNSKSFGQKTEYAQEKYLKKKEKIYGDVLIFQKPSISILSDFYFRRDPHKVLGMRPDSLSQVLSYANVHANQKYLIFENCFGLVVAAVLQRLGGSGLAMHCHIGSIPQRQALVCMNFTDHDLEPMKSLDLLHLLKERASTEKVVKEDAGGPVSTSSEDEPKTKKQKLDVVDINVEIDSDNNGKDVTAAPEQNQNVDEDSFVASRKLRHTNNKEENEKSVILFNETEFDALIICGKEHPLSLFKRLSVRLALSSPFVIFCQYPEPLMDCYVWAKENGVGCNVHLIDNWFRNIQVETERTHPEIQMSPSGGYMLYGTYIGSA